MPRPRRLAGAQRQVTCTSGDAGGRDGADAGADGLDGGAGTDGNGTTGADGAAGSTGFRHPGILHTQADLDRMRAKVNAGSEPWKSGWDRLIGNSFAQTSYQPNPQQEVCAGGNTTACPNGETFMPLARDAAAAYQNALRFRVSGDTAHADKAIAILNAWSSTLTAITGDSNGQLRAGLYGYQLAAAAELVRDYAGFTASDFARLKDKMVTIFYATCSRFLQLHNGTCFDHCWARSLPVSPPAQ